MAEQRLCSIPDCDKPVKCSELCGAHYKRLRRHGDPLKGRVSNGIPMAFIENVVLPYEGDECIFWPYAKNPAGYGQIRLNGKNRLVTRIICERIYGPPIGDAKEAAHSCNMGHRGCVTKSHLSWKTRKENELDKEANGTRLRGERSSLSKFTEEQVRTVRRLLGTMPQKDIADLVGMSRPHVTAIKKGTAWAHLP